MEPTDFIASIPAGTTVPSNPLVNHVTEVTANITNTYLYSASAKNIALLPVRLLLKVDHVLFETIPNFVLRTTGLERVTNRTVAAISGLWARDAAAGAAGRAGAGVAGVADTIGGTLATGAAATQARAQLINRNWSTLITEAFQVSTFKSYWSMLHYVFSQWALVCFVMALVLNRVNVYGAARRRVTLTWMTRLSLRLIPVLLFTSQIHQLLQAMRCQTSPDFAIYRHGDIDDFSLLDWSQEGGFWHQLSSTVLWQSDDQAACAALGMSREHPDVKPAAGSFSLLWPTFLKLCMSHLVENLSCSLQQVAVQTEVGMSVFEHSLAFAEAETMIAQAVSSSSAKSNSTIASTETPSGGTVSASGTLLFLSDTVSSLGGYHMLNRFNIPVEVLVVALLSCCNALTSHIISIIGQQRRLRLINTGFWGLAFMAAFLWGFFSTSSMVRVDGTSEPRPVSGLLHFPTVAIIGFLPHMLVVLGISVCAIIYVAALILTAISLGTNPDIRQPSSLSDRISIAHDNLQAAMQIKGLNIRWNEDFYTALLRLGFAALTAASEAVFLNEGRAVEMRQFTWLEEERIDELEATRSDLPENGTFQIAEQYGLPPSRPGGDDKGGEWQSGYAKERKFDKKEGQLQTEGTFIYPNPRNDGVGALQRTTRFYLLFIYIRGIVFLAGGWCGYGFGKGLDFLGITARPKWLERIVGKSLKRMDNERKKLRENTGTKMLEFWLIDGSGALALPKDEQYDIEPEMRKRVVMDQHENIGEALDDKMYNWWKMGGWFGTTDTSGEFEPETERDDDLTSVISMSTNTSVVDSDHENDWESESDGRRTPTQATTTQSWSFGQIGRNGSATPDTLADTPLDAVTLARLLNPQDQDSKDEARILAAHLAASASQDGRIVTRSQYRRQLEGERARILFAGRVPTLNLNQASSTPDNPNHPRSLTRSEEAEALEYLILSRRKHRHLALQPPSTSQTPQPANDPDSESSHTAGPPCVVCQSSPRTIIAWPCRCLALCEDCRVSLAMNNFGNCVTCRRNVGGFVRLYVP